MTSRRDLTASSARIDQLIAERDTARTEARVVGRALERIARELSELKDEVALNIVASQHPSSADSSAHAAATALREACEARGIDLRIELARLEGSLT